MKGRGHVTAGDYSAVGDDGDGWIVLLPKWLVQAAVIDALGANVSGADAACYVIVETPATRRK